MLHRRNIVHQCTELITKKKAHYMLKGAIKNRKILRMEEIEKLEDGHPAECDCVQG